MWLFQRCVHFVRSPVRSVACGGTGEGRMRKPLGILQDAARAVSVERRKAERAQQLLLRTCTEVKSIKS